MIMIAGHLPGMPFPDFSFRFTKPIPDGKTPSVLLVRTLNLICGGGCTPQKILRKRAHEINLRNPPRKICRRKPSYVERRTSGPTELAGPCPVELRKTSWGSTLVAVAAKDGS